MTDKAKKKSKGPDQSSQPYPVSHSTGIKDLDVEADEKYWRENYPKHTDDRQRDSNDR